MAAFVYNKGRCWWPPQAKKKCSLNLFFLLAVLQNFSLLLLFQEISEKILRWPQPPGATPHPPEATLAPLDVILHPPVVFRRPLCNFSTLYVRYVGCAAPDGALLRLWARRGPWVASGHPGGQ